MDSKNKDDLKSSESCRIKQIAAEETSARIISIILFLLSFIVLGLPLWWQTTSVYRVPLPYNQIKNLTSLKMKHYIPITIILADFSIKDSLLWNDLIKKKHLVQTNFWQIQYSWNIRYASEDEEHKLILNEDLKEYNGQPGHFQIYVKPYETDSPSNAIFKSFQRSAILYNKSGMTDLVEEIIWLTSSVILKEERLKNLYIPPTVRKPPDIERMRSLDATTSIDIAFSLVNPEPHHLKVYWDIKQAIEEYVKPFLSKLSKYIKFDIKSQMIYMTRLNVESTYNATAKCNVWTRAQLPHVINPIEGKLGSHITTNPTLNFIIYIPPLAQTPLYIYNDDGTPLETNAFLSPQWGGVHIANADGPIFKVNMQKAMGVFLSQLRLLLGIPFPEIPYDKPDFKFKNWEMDYFIRHNTQQQIAQAASSLISLGNLLDTIQNIVITDEIGDKIYKSVEGLETSLQLLEQGYLEEAFTISQIAFINSEEAFFNPSLLALLYFPDNEKYAIYVPLFFPITIPMLLSLRSLWRHLKKQQE